MLPNSIAGGSRYFPAESTHVTQDIVNRTNDDSEDREAYPPHPAIPWSSKAGTIQLVDNDAVNQSVQQEGEDTGKLAEKTPLSSRKVLGQNVSSWLSNTWGIVSGN